MMDISFVSKSGLRNDESIRARRQSVQTEGPVLLGAYRVEYRAVRAPNLYGGPGNQ